jgi:hypothetical protein
MAKKPAEGRRKLVEFDAPTWHALNLLSRESMRSFQELADEAFRDLLHKQGRPTRKHGKVRSFRQKGRAHARGAANTNLTGGNIPVILAESPNLSPPIRCWD